MSPCSSDWKEAGCESRMYLRKKKAREQPVQRPWDGSKLGVSTEQHGEKERRIRVVGGWKAKGIGDGQIRKGQMYLYNDLDICSEGL